MQIKGTNPNKTTWDHIFLEYTQEGVSHIIELPRGKVTTQFAWLFSLPQGWQPPKETGLLVY